MVDEAFLAVQREYRDKQRESMELRARNIQEMLTSLNNEMLKEAKERCDFLTKQAVLHAHAYNEPWKARENYRLEADQMLQVFNKKLEDIAAATLQESNTNNKGKSKTKK